MRILVTGATGFVGRHFVRAAIDRRHEVAGIRRPGAAASPAGSHAAIQLTECDFEDRDGVRGVVDELHPDALVHLAWYTRPGDYLVSPENLGCLRSTLCLFEAAFEAGCRRIVAAGTCLEYGDSPLVRREDHALDPRSLYAASKVAAWFAGRMLAIQHSARLIWARIFHVYGPGENEGRLIPTLVRHLEAGEPFAASAGAQIRDPVHVSDVATALVCLVERGDSAAYNVALGRPVTLRETLETVADLLGAKALLQFGSRAYAPDEMMFLVGDPTRLSSLGWTPKFGDLRAGLRDTLRGLTARSGKAAL